MRDRFDTDIEYLREWIGRTDTCESEVTAAPAMALSKTLDRDDPPPHTGDPLPLLWHWLYAWPMHRQDELAADGHARLGGFLPPVALPRRLYAGGSVDVRHPLRVGDSIVRVSQVVDVTPKHGRTGALVFVRVRHDISNRDGLALTEHQDLVYRAPPNPGDEAPRVPPSPADAAWSREVRPDEVFLFRYSALTFNGYRLHYDRRFATLHGYPGLVVHAPLVATLLADLLTRQMPHAAISHFSFRAVQPLFDGQAFQVCGRPGDDGRQVTLWARSPNGGLAMEAMAAI